MELLLTPELLLTLAGVALVAGVVDAIAGGGGLLTVPALMAAGLPPTDVLGTNKLQGSFGTLSATVHFLRRGHIQLRETLLAVVLTFAGAGAGTLTVQRLDPGFLSGAIPVLLLANAAYFLFSPRVGEVEAQRRLGPWSFALLAGFSIGFYDGFFGPGTGSFFALAFVALLGYTLGRATAHAKLLNLTSNVAALLFFALGGNVVWGVGLAMAGGQWVGAWVGSHLVIRHGARIVRPLVVVVCLAMTLKLLL